MCRRAVLRGGTLLFASSALDVATTSRLLANNSDEQPRLRIGLITDTHYADKERAGSRYYRQTLEKLAEAGGQFAVESPTLVVELGDFIDAAEDLATEKKWLGEVIGEFKRLPGEKHFVLGNHCVATLTKQEFLDGVEQEKAYYSFEKAGYHIVVLDACFRKDGVDYGRNNFVWTDPNLSATEIEWLEADLAATEHKTIIFVHQRLDVEGSYGVKNANQVRKILEQSGKVLAVFQGHNHVNDHKLIGGIHYCTLMAMVEGSGQENNAFAVADILSDDVIRIRGFRKQQHYEWTPTTPCRNEKT